MIEREINGKARLVGALTKYELLCYEKYEPYSGEIVYSAEHIRRMARIINHARAGARFGGAAKYAAIAAAAAFAVFGGYVTVEAMQNEIFGVPGDTDSMLEYTLSADKSEYTVTGIGSAEAGDIVIPAEFNGMPVTGIGENAFRGNEKITSVVISNGIKSIGIGAFAECTNIRAVIMADSVE
jgi:hypothetical protein